LKANLLKTPFSGCAVVRQLQPEKHPERESRVTSGIREQKQSGRNEHSAQQHIGMVVAPAPVTQLNEFLRATGTVQPIDSKVGVVGPLARGRIAEVQVKIGDRVEAGQTLAVFDNIEAIAVFFKPEDRVHSIKICTDR